MSDTTRPKPPDHLDGEALLEFHRVCDELADAGRLDKIDRAMLTLYALTWSTWHEAEKNVQQFGPVQELPNHVFTTTPFYNVAQQKAALLRGLLNDMGLTFKTKPRTATVENEELTI